MRSARGILVAYVLLLLLSLPFTPALVDALKAKGLLEAVVGALFALTSLAAAYVLIWRVRIRSVRYYVFLVAILVVLAVIVAFVKTHQERVHFLEYGLLAVLAGREVRDPKRALALAGFLGVLDEGIQFLLPMRYFDPRDIAFNVVAAAFGTAILMITRRFARDFHTP